MYLSTNYLVLVLVEWSRGKVSASKTKRALPLKNGPKANFLELSLRLNLLENFYTCMCVCVCVCERERERQRDRETERDRENWERR